MSNAIWALIYDITEENLGEYLAWFHEVHIPEKLSRDGYEWAGHYKGCSQQSTRYIAFFGGISTRTFFDPCLLYTSPSPRDVEESRMPSSA